MGAPHDIAPTPDATLTAGEDAAVDAALLAAYAAGDRAALDRLIARHADRARAAALNACRDPAVADDAAQATFLVLMRRAARLPRETVVAGWVVLTARRCARDIQRAERRRKRHERHAAPAAPALEPSEPADDELMARLDGALSALPDAQRDAIVLRHLQGRSHAECARVLNCTETAFHTRLVRGMAALRSRLHGREAAALGALALVLAAPAPVAAATSPVVAASLEACREPARASATVLAAAGSTTTVATWSLTAVATLAAAALVVAAIAAPASEPSPPPRAMAADDPGAALDALRPTAAQTAWRDLGWLLSFADARRRAAAERRPILLWIARGHPLGLTSLHGMRGRALVGDAEVAAFARRCVPLAIDDSALTAFHHGRGPALSGILLQPREAGLRVEGLYCLTPAGDVLGHVDLLGGEADAAGTAAMLRGALERWQGVADQRWDPEAGLAADPAARVPAPPPGASVLRVIGQAPSARGDSALAGVRWWDHAWILPEESRALAPAEAVAGMRIAVPTALLRRLGRFHLGIATADDRGAWPAEAVGACDGVAVVERASAGELQLRLDASLSLADAGRVLSARLRGGMTVDRSRGTVTRVELLAEVERTAQPGAPAQQLRLVLELEPDPALAPVPPHGARALEAYLRP